MSQTRSHIITRLFPPPHYLTFAPVAIDFSIDAIRVMRMKHSGIGIVPDFYKEVKLKDACQLLETPDDLKRCQEVKAVLSGLKKEFKLHFVTVSLPETKTYVFRTTIPRAALQTADETIAFKIEENVPLDPGDVLFDFHIIENGKGSEHIDVVVFTLPKSVVSAYSALLKEVGLFPISFESESQSLARAVVSKNDPSSYLILNMADTKIGVAIVEDNTVQYTSSFPITGKDVVSDFSSPATEALKKQINKLLIYWFTNKDTDHDRQKIETVILAGTHGAAPGLVEYLEKHLSIQATVANVWKNCFDLNDYVPQINKAKSLEFGISVGMALKNI